MLLSGWARAAGLRVALVRSPDATPLVRDATTRLAAELRAAGFDAVDVNVETAEDARDVMDDAASGAGAFATLCLRPVANRASIDVWIADAMSSTTSVRRIDAMARKKAASPRAIAVLALDLLRVSLLEAHARKRPQRAQPSRYDHEAHAHR